MTFIMRLKTNDSGPDINRKHDPGESSYWPGRIQQFRSSRGDEAPSNAEREMANAADIRASLPRMLEFFKRRRQTFDRRLGRPQFKFIEPQPGERIFAMNGEFILRVRG